MKKAVKINETLNKILQEVISGVDYVSKIALETQKSIPVVHRQLEVLVDFGVLVRQRVGKKISYEVDWINLSDMISSTLLLDFEKFREIIKAEEKENAIIKEIEKLMKQIPIKIINDKKEMDKLVYNFFLEEEVQKLFKKFLVNLGERSKFFSKYEKMDFNESVNLFLDIFNEMNEEKLKKVLGLSTFKKHKLFLDYCKTRHLQKKAIDPSTDLLG